MVTLSPYVDKDEEYQEFIRHAESVLSGKPFVTEMKATDGELAVYVNDGGSAIPVIMQLLASHGIKLRLYPWRGRRWMTCF